MYVTNLLTGGVQAEVSRLEGEAASISLATEEQYAQYQQLKQVPLLHPLVPDVWNRL